MSHFAQLVRVRQRGLALTLVLSIIAFAPLTPTPRADAIQVRSGALIDSFQVLMTSTAAPDYSPPASSSPSLKLYFGNQAYKNNVTSCAGSFSCQRDYLREGPGLVGETTTVIGPGSDASTSFEIASGTALPVGFRFAGRGGKPGEPGMNPVNVAGAPDSGTETVRVCYAGVFIGGFSDVCKFAREAKAGDTFNAGSNGPSVCPFYNNSAETTYGRDGTNGIPHVAMVTNDAGPVNRTWGPIPGNTGDIADYSHPNGQLWDVRRQRWAYARWTMTTCHGLTIGGLGGSQAFAIPRSIFIYKNEPVEGAWTFSIMEGEDDRLGTRNLGGMGSGFKSCDSVTSVPPNPCRATIELAMHIDLGGANPVGRTWSSCGGSHYLAGSFADRVTSPGHSIAGAEIVAIEEAGGPCMTTISGRVTNSSGKRVSAYSVADGAVAASGFTNGSGDWSLSVPMSSCAAPGGGYKVFAEAPAGFQPLWYPTSTNYTEASCVSVRADNVNLTLSTSGPVTGYVKNATTAADVDGATIYAYRNSDGQMGGWAKSGIGAPGRYSLALDPGQSYRLLVHMPTGYADAWFDGASSFTTASPTVAPSTANFSVRPSTTYFRGYTKDATDATDLNGTILYFYDAANGRYVGWAKTGSPQGPGRYQYTATTLINYKVLARGPYHEDQWLDGAPGYAEATPTPASDNTNFSLRPAGFISGTVTQSGAPLQSAYVSAYTPCGCTTPQNAVTNSLGQYTIKVPNTAFSYQTYRLRFIPPTGQTRWYSNATSFAGAVPVSAPSSGINQNLPS